MRRARSALASVVRAIAVLMALVMTRPAGVTGGSGALGAESEALIRVTAVVTDQRGRLLGGLTPADFELLVDGKPHTVDLAELSVPAAVPRAFAFFLDEFHTAPGDSTAIRDALLRFVDQLKPTDVAVAVKPLDPLTAIRLTADRDHLRRVIATFEGRKGDYAPRTAFERNYMAQAPAAVASARGQIVTSALRAIGLALSQAGATTPAIVLVSDGFERMRTGRDVPANLQSVVRIANRAGAPVYAFAPTLSAPSAEPDATERGINALRALSAETGGDLVVGTGALDGGLSRMMRDLDNHYVLTYKPSHGNDGKFHALSIAVKRAGVQVRARTGYVAPYPVDTRAAAAPLPSRILRRSSLIQSWSGITPIEPGRTSVTVTWEPSATRLGMPQTRRAASIVLTASLTDGTVLFDGVVAPASEAATSTVPNRATFDAPAGRLLVDMRILDAKGVVLDTDGRDVTVPSVKKDSPTVFPPEVIRARSAREFREAVRNPTTAPTAARDFRRTERLLFRVPALDPSGAPAPVTAALLNRLRQPMRTITPLDEPSVPQAITLFDLPLASLAPGEYTVRFSVSQNGITISEHVTFRVQG